MSKEVYLCEGQPKEYQTQFRYTPDPGVVETAFCGVCRAEMNKTPSVNGARGFAMAIAGSKSLHDVFTCPRHEEEWHEKVVAIRKEARETASDRLKKMLLDEADDILDRQRALDAGLIN